MPRLLRLAILRYLTPFAAAAILVLLLVFPFAGVGWWLLVVASGFIAAVGVFDLLQFDHSLWRNYPVISRFRWMIEGIRPQIRQYLLESDNEAAPFSRAQRSLVYRRAKEAPSVHPFGTLYDVYEPRYRFVQHSLTPAPEADPKSYRITIGNDQCSAPYSASILNVSAMSFGSLSSNAIRALNEGAKMGNFYHDTGEGGLSRYHKENGGDLVWEIASGYFGCRTADGHFDPEQFRAKVRDPQVKMIEVKLSQGAKPGHGGVLPAAKVSAEIAAARGVPMGVDCVSPARHSAFSTPIELLQFIQQLRELSGGKPVGFKLCIGLPWEFMAIAKAMLKTGIVPDFVVVDGAEGGTGAAPVEFSDHIGVPMREGLLVVHNTLVGTGLRPRMKIGVAGKVISAFDMVAVLATGADWVNMARGFMFALGCVQSLKCHTNLCPTGIATQDPSRVRGLVVSDKSKRVAQFHERTVRALAEMLAAAGLSHPDELEPHHVVQRISTSEIRQFDQVHKFLRPNALLAGDCAFPFYAENWARASADAFAPVTPPSTCMVGMKNR